MSSEVPRPKQRGIRFALKLAFQFLLVLVVALAAWYIWNFFKGNQYEEKYRALVDKYNHLVEDYTTTLRLTTFAYIHVGLEQEGMPISVYLRTLSGSYGQLVQPVVQRVEAEEDRRLVCYRSEKGRCSAFSDSITTLSTADCYACEPALYFRALTKEGEWAIDTRGKPAYNTLTLRIFELPSATQPDLKVAYFRDIETSYGNLRETYQFDPELQPLIQKQINDPEVKEIIHPGLVIEKLVENQVYQLGSNAGGGLYLTQTELTLANLQSGVGPDELRSERPLRLTYEGLERKLEQVKTDSNLLQSRGFQLA